MANVLRLISAATGGSGVALDAVFTPPGSATVNVYAGDEYAIEYDLWIETIQGGGVFTALDFVSYFGTLAYPGSITPLMLTNAGGDHEGITTTTVAGVDALVVRATGKWYRRVVNLPKQTVDGLYHSFYTFKLGVWATTSGSTNATCVARIANVRVTNHRETVFWIWRDGMANPTGYTGSGLYYPTYGYPPGLPPVTGGTPPTLASFGIIAPELQNYYAGGAPKPLDDIRHDRRVGGRLNSTLFWDWTRDAFVLTGIRLDEQGRWDLRTFYDLFRGESFVYRHQANLPGMWCRFNGPPQFDMVVVGSKVFYDTTISLLQR